MQQEEGEGARVREWERERDGGRRKVIKLHLQFLWSAAQGKPVKKEREDCAEDQQESAEKEREGESVG